MFPEPTMLPSLALLLFSLALSPQDKVQPQLGPGIGDGRIELGTDQYPFRYPKPGITAPVLIEHPDPVYSQQAAEKHYEGTVVLLVDIGTDGLTKRALVMRSLGMGLDEAAIAAVKKWRWRPATKDGKPVAVFMDIEVSFKLH
jgi:periplasmic protein TonB